MLFLKFVENVHHLSQKVKVLPKNKLFKYSRRYATTIVQIMKGVAEVSEPFGFNPDALQSHEWRLYSHQLCLYYKNVGKTK